MKNIDVNMGSVDFPIDLVYMWVDDGDEEWRSKRDLYRPTEQRSTTADATSAARWRNNDELRYSLRSVEMFAPWVNHIYIVTDNQRPAWLVADHPKVTIVDHRDIIPAEALPTFNSTAIEACLHRIEGLSEHFIFGNDDMLLSAPVSPGDFFHADGRPIVRLMHFSRRKAHRKGNYHRMLYHMQNVVRDHCGRLIPLAPHHNLDGYLRSAYEECVTTLCPEEWRRTTGHRFRDDADMQRSAVSYYMIAKCGAEARRVGRFNRIEGVWNRLRAVFTNRYASDSRVVSLNLPDYEAVMRKYNPLMICVNDNQNATEADCLRMKEFLAARYPHKSSFEK